MSHKLLRSDDKIFCINTEGMFDRLESGQYRVGMTKTGDVFLEPMQVKTDKILRLPGSEFAAVTSELDHFLSEECRVAFGDLDYTYNDAWLLYGRYGTGKSYLVNRIAEMVIAAGGVVLFDPDPRFLTKAYQLIDSTSPGRLVLVVLEEFDSVAQGFEEILLKLLDGQNKRANTLFVATTNYIHKIPKRLMRPSRFPYVLAVKEPSREAREFYLRAKLVGERERFVEPLLDASEGFTIDELKEVTRSVVCLRRDLEETVARLKVTAKLGKESAVKKRSGGPGSLQETIALLLSRNPDGGEEGDYEYNEAQPDSDE